MPPRKRRSPVPPPAAPAPLPARLPRPDHGLTEDELEEVRIALEIDDRAGLPAVLEAITRLDNDRRELREIARLLDVPEGGDIAKAATDLDDRRIEFENEHDELELSFIGGTDGLEDLYKDLRELVALLEPRLGGFRDDEPREVFDLRVLVDRLARRLGR